MITTKKHILSLPSEPRGWVVSRLFTTHPAPLLVIVNDLGAKPYLEAELKFFTDGQVEAADFPDPETLPYDPFSPHIDLTSARLRLLANLPHLKSGVVLVGAATLMQRLAPLDFIKAEAFSIQVGDELDLMGERTALSNAGYNKVEQVMAPGEYALRGSIFDIFPMGATTPYRLDLFDTEVESIRDFDIDTQRSEASFTKIEILPAHEFPLEAGAVNAFTKRFEAQLGKLPKTFSTLKQGMAIQGLEYYLPLFFDATATLFDYLPPQTTIIYEQGLEAALNSFEAEINERFAEKRYDLERPPLPPEALFLKPDAVFKRLKEFARFELLCHSRVGNPVVGAGGLDPRLRGDDKTLYTAATPGREQLLREHLLRQKLHVQSVKTWSEFLHAAPGAYLTVAPIFQTFSDPKLKISLIPDTAMLGAAPALSKRQQRKRDDSFEGLSDFAELKLNDIVVHREHGIGRYLGLTKLDMGEDSQEFLTIEYQKGDKLYVPIHHIDLISRYSIGELQNVPLNQLGSDRWKRTIDKAAKRITDLAAELLELYAKRMSTPGFACKPPNADYQEFVLDFPFEETDDQTKAIDEIIHDMTRPNPMDRLLCGDVGFGKTEVAMRAAFLAVQNHKQVAILVPTTLLAEQHFENFQNRFARFPITIAHFSRNTSTAAETEILQKMQAGKIDILIGTHKLIRAKIEFKDLGLIIIDEEHRFGVKDKERLRSFKAHVDTLVMTATPIPRTLNMSLSMLRDLSIISTPPAKRLAVKTFVKERNKALIREAILREVLRGGQVYYLHNDVANIASKRDEIQQLLPNLKIGMGHGQMRPRELERVMADFYHNRNQLLVCSTIIETGIDVANANTIIIENADRFGLAQLHQLRGRVGRSHHQAYAYLLVPDFKALTSDAKKRLEAIEKSTELGSGFTLASHDLEIRGAGEVLGEGQSGHMEDIGFSLYNELLAKAITGNRQGEKLDATTLMIADTADVELNIPRLLPDDYVHDVQQRLSLYQRLKKVTTEDALLQFKMELIDRFGKLPEAAHNLIETHALLMQAKKLGIHKIEGNAQGLKCIFGPKPHFEPITLIRLVQLNAREMQLRGEKELLLKREMKTSQERIDAALWVMGKLQQG